MLSGVFLAFILFVIVCSFIVTPDGINAASAALRDVWARGCRLRCQASPPHKQPCSCDVCPCGFFGRFIPVESYNQIINNTFDVFINVFEVVSVSLATFVSSIFVINDSNYDEPVQLSETNKYPFLDWSADTVNFVVPKESSQDFLRKFNSSKRIRGITFKSLFDIYGENQPSDQASTSKSGTPGDSERTELRIKSDEGKAHKGCVKCHEQGVTCFKECPNCPQKDFSQSFPSPNVEIDNISSPSLQYIKIYSKMIDKSTSTTALCKRCQQKFLECSDDCPKVMQAKSKENMLLARKGENAVAGKCCLGEMPCYSGCPHREGGQRKDLETDLDRLLNLSTEIEIPDELKKYSRCLGGRCVSNCSRGTVTSQNEANAIISDPNEKYGSTITSEPKRRRRTVSIEQRLTDCHKCSSKGKLCLEDCPKRASVFKMTPNVVPASTRNITKELDVLISTYDKSDHCLRCSSKNLLCTDDCPKLRRNSTQAPRKVPVMPRSVPSKSDELKPSDPHCLKCSSKGKLCTEDCPKLKKNLEAKGAPSLPPHVPSASGLRTSDSQCLKCSSKGKLCTENCPKLKKETLARGMPAMPRNVANAINNLKSDSCLKCSSKGNVCTDDCPKLRKNTLARGVQTMPHGGLAGADSSNSCLKCSSKGVLCTPDCPKLRNNSAPSRNQAKPINFPAEKGESMSPKLKDLHCVKCSSKGTLCSEDCPKYKKMVAAKGARTIPYDSRPSPTGDSKTGKGSTDCLKCTSKGKLCTEDCPKRSKQEATKLTPTIQYVTSPSPTGDLKTSKGSTDCLKCSSKGKICTENCPKRSKQENQTSNKPPSGSSATFGSEKSLKTDPSQTKETLNLIGIKLPSSTVTDESSSLKKKSCSKCELKGKICSDSCPRLYPKSKIAQISQEPSGSTVTEAREKRRSVSCSKCAAKGEQCSNICPHHKNEKNSEVSKTLPEQDTSLLVTLASTASSSSKSCSKCARQGKICGDDCPHRK